MSNENEINNFCHVFYNISNYQNEYILNDCLTINIYLKCCDWFPNTRNKGGILQLYVKNTLIITENGSINARNLGYFGKYGIGKGKNKNSGGGYGSKGDGKGGGVMYGDEQITNLYLGSPSGVESFTWYRGGGIIELIATKIINNGQITCNGGNGCSGGSIKIRCQVFVNNGSINANGGGVDDHHGSSGGGDGRIAIFCEEFKNNNIDSIKPIPFINNKTYKYNKDIKNFTFTKINYEQKHM
eukprot:338758_1